MAANIDHETQSATRSLSLNGPPTRLTESAGAAVDLCTCGCGTLHLHMGALTLRLSEETLCELLTTLSQAVVANELHNDCDQPESFPTSWTRQRPSEA